MRVEHGGRSLHVEVEELGAGGGPTLIALHGGPGFAHDYFRPFLTPLARAGVRIVYVDLPGGGRASAHAGPDASLEPFITDIDAVKRAVGSQRIVLLGHAWGALLAVEYALARDVEALVLVNPLRILRAEGQDHEAQARRVEAVDPSLTTEFMERLYPRIEAARVGGAALWREVGADPWWTRILSTQLAGPPSAAWTEALGKIAWGMETYFNFKGAAFSDPGHVLNQYDLAARAAGLRIPTLIIASDNDANYVAPARIHAMPLADAIPGSEVARFDAWGHFPFAEAPEAFCAAVTGFLQRHGLRAEAKASVAGSTPAVVSAG